jgi:hypothetical protein
LLSSSENVMPFYTFEAQVRECRIRKRLIQSQEITHC